MAAPSLLTPSSSSKSRRPVTLLVSFFFRWAFAGLKRAARWPGEASTAQAMASTLHGRQALRQRTRSLKTLCQHSGDSLFSIE